MTGTRSSQPRVGDVPGPTGIRGLAERRGDDEPTRRMIASLTSRQVGVTPPRPARGLDHISWTTWRPCVNCGTMVAASIGEGPPL